MRCLGLWVAGPRGCTGPYVILRDRSLAHAVLSLWSHKDCKDGRKDRLRILRNQGLVPDCLRTGASCKCREASLAADCMRLQVSPL